MLRQVVKRCWLVVPGALATVTLGAHLRRLPSEQFWSDRDAWILVAFIVIGLVTVLEPVRHAVQAARDERRERRVGAVRPLIHLCLIEADKATSDRLKIEDIGVHVWEVRLGLRRRWPFLMRRLVKLDDIRLRDTLGRSRVEWTEGKGVIGQCWTRRGTVARDLDEFRGYESAEAWQAEDAEFRLNLTWEEYQRTKDYGGVMAAPMLGKTDDSFRGCLSLDGPEGSFRTLDQQPVRKVLVNTANTIAGTLYDDSP